MKRELAFLTVGLILGIALTLALGAVANYNATGRYTISALGNRVYIIDTQTGELWERRLWSLRSLGTITAPALGEVIRSEGQQMSEAEQQSLTDALAGFLP